MNAYLNVPILGVALLGIAIAYFYDRLVVTEEVANEAPKVVVANQEYGEEEYDL
jgi:mannose/fructose/N-acetylgalactosamine-specific phosphotransferase system component IIC